jgi:multidrug resistance protein
MPGPGGNRILIWMCALIAVNQLGFGSIVPVIALYARSFGVLQSAVGLAIGIYGLARFVVALPVGQLADRIGRRSVLALGGLVTAAGNLLCAYAPDFATFVVARFVSGVGAALVVTTGTIVLADITTPARRGRVMSIYQGTFLFAVGVGPLPGGLLAERYGLAAPFLFYAVAGALAAALAFFRVPETRDLPGAIAAGGEVPPASFAAQLRLPAGRASSWWASPPSWARWRGRARSSA